MTHEQYRKIEPPEGTELELCPACCSKPEVWRYSETADSPTSTAVMCSNSEVIGPQNGIQYLGCMLYMPTQDFYESRMTEAITYWNAFSKALCDQRTQRLLDML